MAVNAFCFRDDSSIFEKPAENAPVLVLFRGIDSEMVMNIIIIKRKNSTPLLSLIKLDYRHGKQQKIGNKS